MANINGWGDGAANNTIGWGQGANNTIGWGDIHADSWAGLTDISGLPTTDPDAQAFITAAAITDPTQQAAINTLVVDLKGYSIWTKMKAVYPFVGGTATSHSYNLRNTAQYQINWNGGQTHDANGYTPGVNGYGNTGFATNLFTSANDFGLSTYIRTNTTSGADIGVFSPDLRYIGSNLTNLAYFGVGNTFISGANTDARAFWQVNRTSASVVKGFKNSSVFVSGTTGAGTLGARTVFIGALNDNGSANFYAGKQHAFDAIHDGLTDTEAANFYTAVQAFQTTIGRSIGTQTVSDADAQAFVTAADIQDKVEADAINNLVIGMKADGLWSKMKAVYPFVGGTASSHKFNLKNPLDTDAAFRMTFHGGVTHSSNGITFATNGYADTKWLPSANSTTSNVSGGAYSRTNLTADYFLLGSLELNAFNGIAIAPKASDNNTYFCANNWVADNAGNYVTDTRGLFHTNRDNLTVSRLYRNGISIRTSIPTLSFAPAYNVFLGARNYAGTAQLYFNGNLAFGFLGDSLNSTEAANFYTAVQNFNTALARQV
jgi:hypothetical protein